MQEMKKNLRYQIKFVCVDTFWYKKQLLTQFFF